MYYPAYVLKASDRVRELDCAAEHTSSYSSWIFLFDVKRWLRPFEAKQLFYIRGVTLNY